jgi:hypothetical protein
MVVRLSPSSRAASAGDTPSGVLMFVPFYYSAQRIPLRFVKRDPECPTGISVYLQTHSFFKSFSKYLSARLSILTESSTSFT